MPTKKPRITITLTPELVRLLEEVSHLQGRTKTEVLTEMLEAMREPFERMVTIMKAAKNAPAEALARFKHQVQAAEASVLPIVGSAMSQMDFLVHTAQGLPQESPPPSNRGVTLSRSSSSSSKKVTPIGSARKPKGRGGKR